MLLLRRKGPKAPFALVTLILLFGKKKPAQVADKATVADSKTEAFPVPDILERDIIGDALTKIYEAEAKGLINEPEKNQLLQRYKTDLKRVDGEVDTHKKTVDLYDLESAKEDLLKSFHEKMLEIDLKISQIRPTTTIAPEEKTVQPPPTPKTDPAQTTPTTPAKERPAREKPKNKAEERLETIREEVLKAMERLEQIETEG